MRTKISPVWLLLILLAAALWFVSFYCGQQRAVEDANRIGHEAGKQQVELLKQK